MRGVAKFKLNKDADEFFKQIALNQVNADGIDLDCPNCKKNIHISFSGDSCKFCGLTIEYGVDPQV